MTGFGQEFATARVWLRHSTTDDIRLRTIAAELLAALWYLELSDRFIHELLDHNHRYVLDGFIAESKRLRRTEDDAHAGQALTLVQKLSPEDRTAVFEIVQASLVKSNA